MEAKKIRRKKNEYARQKVRWKGAAGFYNVCCGEQSSRRKGGVPSDFAFLKPFGFSRKAGFMARRARSQAQMRVSLEASRAMRAAWMSRWRRGEVKHV